MKTIYLILISVLLIACSKSDSKIENHESEWSIDSNEITGEFSLFPLALNPEFTVIDNVNLSNDERVGVVNFGNEIRVYPYVYVNQYEIINDVYNGQKFAFSYCPITKSAVAFKREQVFRASGYLFKNNITPWDEKTESIWSQMLLKGIRGPNKNKRLVTIPVLETKLGTVREYFPNAKIMGLQNFENRIATPPDGDDSHDIENEPQGNEFAYGILDNFNNIFIFKYSDFSEQNLIRVNIQSQEYLVYGDYAKRVINAFKVTNNDNFQIIHNQLPYVIESDNGVKYDFFGRGSNGTILQKPKYAYVAIWDAWSDFYNNFTFQE